MTEPAETAMRSVLHVGCGSPNLETLHRAFRGPAWRKVRLDIDEGAKPDIVASIVDMAPVDAGGFDALYSSHNIEHLFPHDVPTAFGEFARVLKPDGFALITCPDLQSIAALIADDKLEDPAYTSPAGPIAPWICFMACARHWLAGCILWLTAPVSRRRRYARL